jgi:hypothetical protein
MFIGVIDVEHHCAHPVFIGVIDVDHYFNCLCILCCSVRSVSCECYLCPCIVYS